MRHTVDLDYELSVERDEVNDISVDWVLAAKFPSCQPAITQCLP